MGHYSLPSRQSFIQGNKGTYISFYVLIKRVFWFFQRQTTGSSSFENILFLIRYLIVPHSVFPDLEKSNRDVMKELKSMKNTINKQNREIKQQAKIIEDLRQHTRNVNVSLGIYRGTEL